MGVLEYILFLCARFLALVELEVCTHGLTENGMTKIFLPVQYLPYRGHAPQIRVGVFLPIGLLLVVSFCVCGGNQDLFLGEQFRYRSGAFALAGKQEDTLYHFGGFGVNNKRLLIAGKSVVAVGNTAGATLAVPHTGVKDSLDLVTGVFGVKLVHDIEERGKVVVGGVIAVYAVVDSDKTHILLWENDFRIKANLQVIPAKTG